MTAPKHDNRKATAHKTILPWLPNSTSEVYAEYLAQILNKCIEHSYFPKEVKRWNVKCPQKKGQPNLKANQLAFM